MKTDIEQILADYKGQTFSEPLEAERWLIAKAQAAAQETIQHYVEMVQTHQGYLKTAQEKIQSLEAEIEDLKIAKSKDAKMAAT